MSPLPPRRPPAGARGSRPLGPRPGYSQRPMGPSDRPRGAPPSARVNPGERLAPPSVVHEDARILVVNKPAGSAVTLPPQREDGARRSASLTDWVLARARRSAGPSARPKLKAVTNLEIGASGLVVYAKDEEAYENLRAQFRSRKPHRIALAVVKGHPRAGDLEACALEGTVRVTPEDADLRDDRGPARRGPARGVPTRSLVTHFRVVRAWRAGCLLRLRLETDENGQALDHLRRVGSPVLIRRNGPGRATLHLHLAELGFIHPGSGLRVRYVAEEPADFVPAGGRGARDLSRETRDDTGRGGNERDVPAERGWDHVAEWYDALISEQRSDHFERVIYPGVLRLLEIGAGERVLDVACGQGEFCRRLRDAGARAVGVDASAALLDAARARSGEGIEYLLGDVRALDGVGSAEGPGLASASFDAATCVMALMNIDPIAPVFASIARLVRPGGRVVVVVLHPAFRQAGRSAWAWTRDGSRTIQERRVRAYLSEHAHEVVMNPGSASEGGVRVTTITHNRPIGAYVRAMARGGLVIDAMEEWVSTRQSEPGPRAQAEDEARREIPLFLAMRGRLVAREQAARE